MLLNSLQHCATRLMSVGAVVEAAVLGELEDVLEIACQLFRLNVERAKTLYSRSVDKVATLGQLEHLGERGGVHTCVQSAHALASIHYVSLVN